MFKENFTGVTVYALNELIKKVDQNLNVSSLITIKTSKISKTVRKFFE